MPLEQTLCLKFCSYYKPGKNEELACKGYEVVERLAGEGKSIVPEGSSVELNNVLRDRIVEVLCRECEFHKEDCDFMQSREARPCGGFVLLEQLLLSGQIVIDDIG